MFVDWFKDIKEAGSKEEKISIIIQNMGYPFSALKALSFINLMFYMLSNSKRWSAAIVDRGCKI